MAQYRFIVAAKKYLKHNTLNSAQAEKRRLEEMNPTFEFRIYAVKRGLDPYGNPKPKLPAGGSI